MRNFLVMWRRELAAYFVSPAAYVTMALVLLVVGVGFWGTCVWRRGEPVKQDVLLFWPMTLWAMVLIASTVLTMRLFAEERRSGTIEALMTAPVTEAQVVLGKYAAAVFLFAVIFSPILGYMFILMMFSSGVTAVDAGSLMCGYLILVLVGAFYISIGTLMSALTRSQIVAAISCFAALSMFFSLGLLTSLFSGGIVPVLEHVSTLEHVLDFARGSLDTRPVVFYVSATGLMLFCAVKAVESRRWT